VLTTGGTGPAPRDVTPEATLAVADKVMPGFGEQMRQISPGLRAHRDPVAPGGGDPRQGADHQPAGPAEVDCRDAAGPAEGTPPVHGIFAAVPYCIDLIGGPYLETDEAVCKAFRPKAALPHLFQVGTGADQRKLFATPAEEQVRTAHRGRHGLRHGAQHFIALEVTVLVVDGLEEDPGR
jgi:hypothetical protein